MSFKSTSGTRLAIVNKDFKYHPVKYIQNSAVIVQREGATFLFTFIDEAASGSNLLITKLIIVHVHQKN